MSTSSPGKYLTLLPIPEDKVASLSPSKNVKQVGVLAYFCFGEAFTFIHDMKFPAMPEQFEFTKTFINDATKLLADGKVKAHKITLDKHGKGLEGVMKGMEAMKNGEVSGEKLVYHI